MDGHGTPQKVMSTTACSYMRMASPTRDGHGIPLLMDMASPAMEDGHGITQWMDMAPLKR
jgi:hypothetical protein